MRIPQYSWWQNKTTGVRFLVVAKVGDNLLLLELYQDETKVFSEEMLVEHVKKGSVKQVNSKGEAV